jgi:deazaflavin-dependent oxidoreductase (nitroreductase family)
MYVMDLCKLPSMQSPTANELGSTSVHGAGATGRPLMKPEEAAEAGAYLYLTTTGRRTGLPREVEIWYTERDGRYYIIAEHGERANWVRNIQAQSRVDVRVRGLQFNATARLVDHEREPELAHTITALSDVKYGWSDGLIVEITPD